MPSVELRRVNTRDFAIGGNVGKHPKVVGQAANKKL